MGKLEPSKPALERYVRTCLLISLVDPIIEWCGNRDGVCKVNFLAGRM